jgi:hypothetical protein
MILNGVAPKSHELKAHVKNNGSPVVGQFGGVGRAATRRASQREARHLEIRTLPTFPLVLFFSAC